MGKFDGLKAYLTTQTLSEVTLAFHRIEALIEAPLPKSKASPQYWANMTDMKANGGRHRAWMDAGYNAFLEAGSGRVRFVREKR